MFLVISHEPVKLQKRALPFRKRFSIINDFVNRQKALKPFFITVIAKNISSLFFAPVSSTSQFIRQIILNQIRSKLSYFD